MKSNWDSFDINDSSRDILSSVIELVELVHCFIESDSSSIQTLTLNFGVYFFFDSRTGKSD